MIPVVYYAHNMQIYGTQQELDELALIVATFPHSLIYNPNCLDIQGSEKPMQKCLSIIKDESVQDVVFSTLPGGIIGAGVNAELMSAIHHDKNVYIIVDQQIHQFLGTTEARKDAKASERYRVIR